MSLREEWDANGSAWVRWATMPGHDSYWRFHGERFLDLLPPAGRLTLDIGCGEGRLGRDLTQRGHAVIALDGSPTLARACAAHEIHQPVALGDAARLPLRSSSVDLAIAFMSLQDIDDLEGAVGEAARVLVPGGIFCVAIVHPINSAGSFEDNGPNDSPFVIRRAYLDRFRYVDDVERDGLTMTFHSEHRPLEVYSQACEAAGFTIEAIREVTEPDPGDRWHQLPLFLHLRALKTQRFIRAEEARRAASPSRTQRLS